MTKEEFDKLENPTYHDYIERYGDFAEFWYAIRKTKQTKIITNNKSILLLVIGFIIGFTTCFSLNR